MNEKPLCWKKTEIPISKRGVLNEVDIRMHQAQIDVPWTASNVYLIGSRTSGHHNEESDVDIAVVLPKGSWTDEDQGKLDSIQEEEYLEGEPEGPTEFDIHLISKDMLRKPYIKI